MPPKAKSTKNAPNQHDKRHENGLIAPGKRVARQRSSGQLNGVPNGKTVPAVSPPALPSKGLNTNPGFRFPKPADGTTAPVTVRDSAGGLEGGERDRTASDASLDDVDPCSDMADGTHDMASLEVHLAAAASPPGKSNPANGGSNFSTVSTILAYYPLRDAISILILLLCLPPTLGLIIQTLFASLTFVPPSAGISALPNIKEMFNSSNFGYPALATILFVDVFFWALWITLWKPAQAIFLDLSQAVIAISLSGAAASTGGPTYSIATCTLIVCVVHVLRYRAIHLTALDYLRSVIHKMDIGTPFDVPVVAHSYHSTTPLERGMAFTALRTILGIHIVSQGVTTCVRRTLANAKANEKDHNIPAIIKTDTEASAGTETLSRANSGLPDSAHSPSFATSTDGRLPGQSPALRDTKPRESSSKKKRKQANQVRSQQPLWAAIASTKVTFVKEIEQRDAADDAREAAAMDNNTSTPFLSVTNNTTDRVWICEVRDTEIYFAVELSPAAAIERADQREECAPVTAGIDKTKPFFIRINGAAWSSTRIMQNCETSSDRYVGEVFGLAPLSSYHCEIVSISKQRVLCSVNLITQPAPTAEQAAAAPVHPPHQSLRPSSPITTLKQSIQSAESKLNETRNRTRKTKKDQRAAHADIKKEINLLKSKLESSGGVDDKQERRLAQISQHKNQAEEATAELKVQIDAIGEIPSAELAESQAKKRVWQSALDAKKAANRDLDNFKTEQERELNALRTDISASESKKEKLVARNTQREQELEKLNAKHQADMTAKQQRVQDRAQEQQQQDERTLQIRYQIAHMDSEAQSYNQKGQEAYQAAGALAGWSNMQGAPAYPGYSSPPTPEGMHSTLNGQPSPRSNGFPAGPFGPQTFGSPFAASQPGINHMHTTSTGGPRGRSSSMLSQISGFTDNADEYDFMPMGPQHQHTWPQTTAGASQTDRKASDGNDSGSISGSGGASLVNGSTNGSNSPRPDAKPFVPAVKSVGTIGPPGRKTPQSPPAFHAGANGR
ncbi:uncharacterized protein RCC_09111 [Ramularia collo-cygni]|uniref:Ubiquitination network signaling protein acrB n=1 Tax=Ramularia collo-cygni TaxID=112498 RepID=A0A2D3UZB3_9PEZI|nr:uncharacterized protein RCC_09111 [Ramularia collo-cygni]CZT23397.1 uncharacterized protein RCC_09111 [Ramularia collo-cygni]